MSFRSSISLTVLFAAAQGCAGHAPSPSALPVVHSGERLRLELVDGDSSHNHSSQTLAGMFVRSDTSAVVLNLAPNVVPVLVPRETVVDVYRSRGRPSRLRNGIIHAVASSAIGALSAWGFSSLTNNRDNLGRTVATQAISGAAIGATLGAMFPAERWRRARLPLADTARR